MKTSVNKKLILISIIISLIILTTTSCQNNKVTQSETGSSFDLSAYENAQDYFITPKELKDGLDNGEILLYDCNKPDIYEKTHIPGAIGIGFHAFTDTNGKPGDPLWGTLVGKEELEKRLKKIGYTPDKTVVFYSDLFSGPGADGRAVWQLTLAGLTNAKILLGGSTYWKESGYEMTSAPSTPYREYTNKIEIKDYDKKMYVTKEEIYANLGTDTIIDVRTEKEYNGSQKAGEHRGGHIKGAKNILWQDLLEKNGVLKSPDEIKKIMADNNVPLEQDTTLY